LVESDQRIDRGTALNRRGGLLPHRPPMCCTRHSR
jgi:hypothetical protein